MKSISRWAMLWASVCLAAFFVYYGCGGDDDDETGDDDAGEDFTCEGDVCTDDTTGLMWQNGAWNSTKDLIDYDAATTYCQSLTLAGFDDWLLPTISDLRSLIRGCDKTVTGGHCNVTDDCLDISCWNEQCGGCSWLAGPASDGAYWPDGMSGEIDAYWSSSLVADSEDYDLVFTIGFNNGGVSPSGIEDDYDTLFVRCVR